MDYRIKSLTLSDRPPILARAEVELYDERDCLLIHDVRVLCNRVGGVVPWGETNS
jgi:hypothetical protein